MCFIVLYVLFYFVLFYIFTNVIKRHVEKIKGGFWVWFPGGPGLQIANTVSVTKTKYKAKCKGRYTKTKTKTKTNTTQGDAQ